MDGVTGTGFNKTLKELKAEKEQELKELLEKKRRLEAELDSIKWSIKNIYKHKQILLKLNNTINRIAELHDFLKELDLNGRRLIRSGEEVITFGKDE